MSRFTKIFIFISFFFFTTTNGQNLEFDIDSLLLGYPSNSLDTVKNPDFSKFNGVVLIASKDEILYTKAFGKANFQWDVDVSVNTKFLIGSISKTFTSMLTMQLVEDGKLRLGDSI